MQRNNAIKICIFYGFLGFALILVATSRYGIGLSSDSVTYLAGAQNIVDGRGYLNSHGAPVLAFPPLFSAVIAVLSAGLFDPASVARFFNALCFGLVVFLTAYWLFRHLHSRLMAWLGAMSVLFSAALIGVSVYAWSEPLFAVFATLMLLQIKREDLTDSLAPWVVSGIFASLAILTRYAGITVVLTGTILIAANRTHHLASRVQRLFLFLATALLPISLWFYRNYSISSTITGYRVASARTFAQAAFDMLNILSLWVLPASVPFRDRMWLLIVLISLFLLIVYVVLRIKITIADSRNIIPFLLFTCIYVIFMIYTTSRTALSPIDDRYMSPIFVPLMMSLFYLVDRLIHNHSVRTGHTLPRALITTTLAIWLLYPVVTTYRTVKAYIEEGAGGFHTTYWLESDLISYLKSNELPGTIYTNEPTAVYALTGEVYLPSPEKFAYGSQVPTDDLLRFQSDLQSQGVLYIVWFHTDWWKGYLYGIDDLKNLCDIDKIATRKDGDVYRMSLADCQ